ncbi:MAG: helix-turn-helix domain-containing protein, partial [Bacteroidetes bacterium]|nr:helix-turn-helix domain-containing protein [Bacteroidota bacterium]
MTFEELGNELRQHRLAKNISLSAISAATRINSKFLHALEEGNFSILPQTYIRAFLREYAVAVGADSNDILSKYNEALQR